MDAGSHAYARQQTIALRSGAVAAGSGAVAAGSGAVAAGSGAVARPTTTASTLPVVTAATLLVIATFGAIATTVGDTARGLGSGVAGETWALSGMSLGLATALLTVGVLADDLGRRRVLVWSTAALAVASTLGALAPNMAMLVGARIAQGAAGAGVIAASLGAIGHAFPADGRARTHATGVWGAAFGGGVAVGPLAAAALAATLGWRSSYWLEAVAALILLPAAARIGESRAETRQAVDVPGAITLASAMAALTAGLVEGRTSWTSPATIALLATGVAMLGVFAAIELRSSRPMLDLRLLAERRFAASLIGSLSTGVALIGLISYLAIFVERAFDVSVIGSALVITIWAATSTLVSIAARSLPARIPSTTRLAAGLALSAAGALLMATLSATGGWAQLIPGLLISGAGYGIANAALGRLAVEAAPSGRGGMSSGASSTARYLGGAAGVALVIAIGAPAQASGLIAGWNTAALVSGLMCALAAVIVARLR